MHNTPPTSKQKTKTATPDGPVVNFGDTLREGPKVSGERMTHDCIVFEEAPECLVGVEATSINKATTNVDYTVVPFESKHTGAPVIGHNAADMVVVKECGTTAINTFVHSIVLAV